MSKRSELEMARVRHLQAQRRYEYWVEAEKDGSRFPGAKARQQQVMDRFQKRIDLLEGELS